MSVINQVAEKCIEMIKSVYKSISMKQHNIYTNPITTYVPHFMTVESTVFQNQVI
jgi:hypothetical protein